MIGLRKLLDSSTFWAMLVLAAIAVASRKVGVDLPDYFWQIAIPSFAVKEAASKIKINTNA